METCVRQAVSTAAAHLGVPKPAQDRFCPAIRALAKSGVRITACAHPVAWWLPTGLCLRLTTSLTKVRSSEFAMIARRLAETGQTFAIIFISTASRLYGVAEFWSHAVSYLFSDGVLEIHDSIQSFDGRFAPVEFDPVSLYGRFDVVSIIVER